MTKEDLRTKYERIHFTESDTPTGNLKQNYAKWLEKELISSRVAHPLPSTREMNLELNTMLKELNKNVKSSYLKRSVLKGVEVGFKKGYDYVSGYMLINNN
jgi:hypothetical protein